MHDRSTKWVKYLAATWASSGVLFVSASAATINDVRLSATADGTRIVFDLSGPTPSKLFTLSDPERVVLDIPGGQLASHLAELPSGRGFIKELRAGDRGNGTL